MFDLLGFVPEELTSFEEDLAELDAKSAGINMADTLRAFGHEMTSDNRIDFVMGVCYAPRIALEVGELEVGKPGFWSDLIACARELKALTDEEPGAILSAEVEVIMRKHGIITLLEDYENRRCKDTIKQSGNNSSRRTNQGP